MKKFEELSDIIENNLLDESFCKSNPQPIIRDDGSEPLGRLISLTNELSLLDFSKERGFISRNSKGNLFEIVAKIEKAEDIAGKFLLSNYYDLWYISKAIEINNISHELDKYLEEIQPKLEKEFVDTYKELKKKKGNLACASTLRRDIELIFNNFSIANQKAKERRLKVYESPAMRDYAPRKQKIEACKQKISSLYENYKAFDSSKDFLKELKRIEKETKSRWYRALDIFGILNPRLAEECKDAEYYEGKIQLDLLRDEIKYVKKNIGNILSAKNNILNDISHFEIDSRIVNLMQEGRLSSDNLRKLTSIRENVKINKNDSYSGMILLQGLVERYRTGSSGLISKANALINSEDSNLRIRYSLIESELYKASAGINDIKAYEILVRNYNSELDKIKSMLEIIGDKEYSQRCSILIKYSQNKLDESKKKFEENEAKDRVAKEEQRKREHEAKIRSLYNAQLGMTLSEKKLEYDDRKDQRALLSRQAERPVVVNVGSSDDEWDYSNLISVLEKIKVPKSEDIYSIHKIIKGREKEYNSWNECFSAVRDMVVARPYTKDECEIEYFTKLKNLLSTSADNGTLAGPLKNGGISRRLFASTIAGLEEYINNSRAKITIGNVAA